MYISKKYLSIFIQLFINIKLTRIKLKYILLNKINLFRAQINYLITFQLILLTYNCL